MKLKAITIMTAGSLLLVASFIALLSGTTEAQTALEAEAVLAEGREGGRE